MSEQPPPSEPAPTFWDRQKTKIADRFFDWGLDLLLWLLPILAIGATILGLTGSLKSTLGWLAELVGVAKKGDGETLVAGLWDKLDLGIIGTAHAETPALPVAAAQISNQSYTLAELLQLKAKLGDSKIAALKLAFGITPPDGELNADIIAQLKTKLKEKFPDKLGSLDSKQPLSPADITAIVTGVNSFDAKTLLTAASAAEMGGHHLSRLRYWDVRGIRLML